MKINQGVPSSLLTKNQRSIADLIERISSGKRILRAEDDASGMQIANLLDSQVRGMGQAMRNASDAISVSQIGEGALGQVSEAIQRVRTLAIQASSAANSPESRGALQAEANRALASIDRITTSTSYNGQPLLTGNFTEKTFQTGTAAADQIAISIPAVSTSTLGNENGKLVDIDLSTTDGAQNAVAIADASLATIADVRGQLGSTVNQLKSTVGNLTTTSLNVEAARSRIGDVDMAEQSMLLANAKILEKAGVFAAAQTGRLNKENILRLLQG